MTDQHGERILRCLANSRCPVRPPIALPNIVMIGFTRALALEVVRKQPRSAIEMAAIVTYYLANMAPKADRKESVGTADLDI